MRRYIVLLACLCFCLQIGYAHPGRTDANGGHYNHATGDYHYHHGYPEHYHTGGTCPYDYDDRTGENDDGSYRSKSSQSAPRAPTVTIEPKRQNNETSEGVVIFGVIVWLVFMYYVCKPLERSRTHYSFYSVSGVNSSDGSNITVGVKATSIADAQTVALQNGVLQPFKIGALEGSHHPDAITRKSGLSREEKLSAESDQGLGISLFVCGLALVTACALSVFLALPVTIMIAKGLWLLVETHKTLKK